MGFTVWFTGLSGAGKSTLSAMVHEEILRRGFDSELLDGDVIRRNFSQELTFSKAHRNMQVRRVGFICHLLNKHGVNSVAALISPYAKSRDDNRALLGNYVEVYVRCPLDVLKRRDPKGLYARALAGEIEHFTGVSDPYEEPQRPDVVVDSGSESIQACFERIMTHLEERDFLPPSLRSWGRSGRPLAGGPGNPDQR